jgi:hypothetical protein
MVQVIQLALGDSMSSLGVKGHTMCWEGHECDQQLEEDESIHIGRSERLRKEGNARINNLSAMRLGFPMTIEKVHISRYFESPKTDLVVADIACGIDYGETWWPNQIH